MAKHLTTPPDVAALANDDTAGGASPGGYDKRIFEVGDTSAGRPGSNSRPLVLAHHRLDRMSDPCAALRTWFEIVSPGGRLIVTTPHAFEPQRDEPLRLREPGRRPYTPASLMEAVEAALIPNTYRVFRLTEAGGPFYQQPEPDVDPTRSPTKSRHLVIIIDKAGQEHVSERLNPAKETRAVETWSDIEGIKGAPHLGPRRIVALLLGQPSQIISGLPALESLRRAFPAAVIILVVASWAADLARRSGFADRIVAFDAPPYPDDMLDDEEGGCPPNELFAGDIDLAIDLGGHPDAVRLLGLAPAGFKAGLGTPTLFPFLDLCLPLGPATDTRGFGQSEILAIDGFASKAELERTAYRIDCVGAETGRENAIIWGPYKSLPPGRYVFEPFIEVAAGSNGAVLIDIALDTRRICGLVLPSVEALRLPFTIVTGTEQFECRAWSVDGAPLPDFSFFGGRLARNEPESALRPGEPAQILVELVKIRLSRSFALATPAG